MKKTCDGQGENIAQKRRKQLKRAEREEEECKAKKRFMGSGEREREGGRGGGQWAIRRFDAQWKSQ